MRFVLHNTLLGPDPPTNTQAFDIGASSATAAWEAPLSCEIESYNLILTEEQFSISPVLISVNSSIISYTFTELEEFNTYTLSVAAVNNVGVGSFSSVNFTTLQAGELKCAMLFRRVDSLLCSNCILIVCNIPIP